MSFFTTIASKFHALFGGTSPVTGYLGSIVFLGDAAKMINEAIASGEVPTDLTSWLILLVGIAMRLSKQHNVTNASVPLTIPVKVETPVVATRVVSSADKTASA